MEGVGHKLFYPIRSGKAGIVKFPKTFYFPFLSSGHLYPSRLYSLPSSNFLRSPLGVVVDVVSSRCCYGCGFYPFSSIGRVLAVL